MDFIADDQEKKLPTGVKVLGIIQFVIYGFSIISTLIAIAMYSTLESKISTTGVKLPSKGMYIISLILIIALIVSIIILFQKSKIGVFAYIGVSVINFILGIVISGLTIWAFLGLILPGLMIFFIFKEKEVFGL